MTINRDRHFWTKLNSVNPEHASNDAGADAQYKAMASAGITYGSPRTRTPTNITVALNTVVFDNKHHVDIAATNKLRLALLQKLNATPVIVQEGKNWYRVSGQDPRGLFTVRYQSGMTLPNPVFAQETIPMGAIRRLFTRAPGFRPQLEKAGIAYSNNHVDLVDLHYKLDKLPYTYQYRL